MDYEKVSSELVNNFKDVIITYTNPSIISSVLFGLIKIVLILIIAKMAIKFLDVAIEKFFDSRDKLKLKLEENRVNTLKGVFKSVSRYTIYFMAAMPILDTVGIDIRTLIAAAGIGGLAIGFGAQNLVRDVITGFFILFEDQFTVGDYVELDGKSGIVEEMALRVTKIRDFNGELHIIPNGVISKVTNRCRGNMRALVNISIAYEEDIQNAINVLNKTSKEILKETNDIVEGPIVLGVTNFGSSDVVITVIAKVKPMTQWAVERLMRQRFKEAFDREGIEIPYSKMVVYMPEK
ncbi:small conductance mechanosensitive channel [Caminicella sporogenes DSM 14501]|uniref:Small conductance mechanosensitive channel n=1 Tax=Caminicella sporogenes DSM 14501 TaxID=1121266 RepID=A0A1M6NF63_9FIRM|nr:mechanosensitive ion channel family protein [Caminicella sporogenes]WIF95843.1 mechanosensitive ion channel family protein [Caminicella sporogenes]SHJ94330.1 small conductance mechanosensitive channel [Caminicella sporogenes DSM 14501]